MKKFILIAVIAVAVICGAIIFYSKSSCDITKFDTSGIILFYGSGCPHCVNVDEYIKANNVKDKVQFEEKEVFYNKCNAQLMLDLQQNSCQLAAENVGGVPFLWDGASSTCLVGDQDIINFFAGKISQ